MSRTAFITGGASGIGKMTAYLLAEKGFSVAINYRNSGNKARTLAKELSGKFGIKATIHKGDISKPEDCERLVREVLSIYSCIDVLIHNAGPYIHERKKMAEYTAEEWNYLLHGNLSSVFLLTKSLLPGMKERGWGRIITMGFDRAETAPGWTYRSVFAAAKAGLVSLTKSIALEEAEFGITANMVCPGDIINEWKEKRIADACEDKEMAAPVGRTGTGEDVARVIAFLTDDQSGFITGSVIPVTGGADVLGKIHRVE
ncbi:SDR family oxidoreductase [Neobacillus terrae]|uniref:SDR family oxidoreductase n=1 Tax=Neobacillus terrae TaxID=3034837 RepID=UPI00140DDA48|nr:SDR family oxidoreductase [Neobacillus terrae]